MNWDALIRHELHGIYMRDPVQRGQLKREAVERHLKYLAHLAAEGRLTVEIVRQDIDMVDWYFDRGGWQR